MDQVQHLTVGVTQGLAGVVYRPHYRTKQSEIEYRRHIRQTGNPTRQLRAAIKETLELLDLLQGTQSEVSAGALAERMSKLSLSLRDLGMREEALGVQTFCVVFNRGLVQQRGQDRQSLEASCSLSRALTNLSACLAALGQREEALRAV